MYEFGVTIAGNFIANLIGDQWPTSQNMMPFGFATSCTYVALTPIKRNANESRIDIEVT